MNHSLKDGVVLITGGTGTFGSAFLERCLLQQAKEIRIFSRDEKKQYDMAHRYRHYPNVKFFLGDVRDMATLEEPMIGVDYVFHAAAMKQVPSCEDFPMEAIKTNVIGSKNVLDAAVRSGARKVVVLSTDKAVYPTSAMGMTKAYMEKIALQKAAAQDRTEICITRFGNLVASRGSAVPVFLEQAQNGLPITITDPKMTRFMMTVGEAAELVEAAFKIGSNGELLVKMEKACTTGDLAKAVCTYLNLPKLYPTEIIGIRHGEKMHEALLTEEEARCAVKLGEFVAVPAERTPTNHVITGFVSDQAARMSEEQVLRLIESVFQEDRI